MERLREFGLEGRLAANEQRSRGAEEPGSTGAREQGRLHEVHPSSSAPCTLAQKALQHLRTECTSAPPRPCTSAQLRENTERPVTVTQGTNTVVGSDPQRMVAEALAILDGKNKAGCVPELWDGRAAERVVAALANRAVIPRHQQGRQKSGGR